MLAGGVFALAVPAFVGFQGDEDIEKFLNAPTVIDKFKENMGGKPTSQGQTPPLVAQAGRFAGYLNPPKIEPTKTVDGGTNNTGIENPPPPRPDNISAKFPVIATCVNPNRPELSWVLIDEPGTGRHWVRQSTKVGHLTIEQVKDGAAIVKGAKDPYTLSVQRKPQMSLLLDSSAPPIGSEPTSGLDHPGVLDSGEVGAVSTVAGTAAEAADATGAAAGVAGSPVDQLSAEEQAAMVEKIFSELEALARTSPDKIASGPRERQNRPASGDVSAPKATHVTGREAEKLDNLGRELKGHRPGPDRAKLRKDLEKRKRLLRERAKKARLSAAQRSRARDE
jgi:hypothetical protein